MGPSLESNGMMGLPTFPTPPERLQWGRRSKATEWLRMSPRPTLTTYCFNGAVARKQRNACGRGRRSTAPRRFNGAVARKQRNVPARACARDGSRICFNGAVARKQRNATDGPERPIKTALASMGPSLESNGMRGTTGGARLVHEELQWGRRSKATECHSHPSGREGRAGFNGAVARKQRNAASTIGVALLYDCFNRAVARKQRNVAQSDIGTEYGDPLQWGRRSKATEWGRRAEALANIIQLQWGRRSKATEWPRLLAGSRG